MKTIDKFRYTNKFCITGTHVSDLAAIAHFFGGRRQSLIAVADDNTGPFEYTVRTLRNGNVIDYRVSVAGSLAVRILEEHVIHGVSQAGEVVA